MKKEYLIYKLSEEMKEATRIDNELFPKFDVKRGLRNEDGTGVLVGLTKIGNVVGYERIPGGGLKPIPGKLFYRGYDVEDISHAIIKEKRFGFEEVAYLLLSGRLPDKEELASFRELINDNMALEQKLLPDPSTLGPRTVGKTNIGCIFTGVKDGKEKTYYIYNVCDHQECYHEVGSQAISYTTGVPAMCGALMMLTGKWIRPGVYTVEEFDPDPFLEALDRYGLPRSESCSGK